MSQTSVPSPTTGLITCVRNSDMTEALALARSAALNSPTYPRAVILEGDISPRERRELERFYSHVVPMRPEHFRLGWQAKNVCYLYSPFDRSLFLDADCLVLRDLTPMFAALVGRAVAFAAKSVPAQEAGRALYAKLSLEALRQGFGVDWWPQVLGGGHFYFERGEIANRLFERALHWANVERVRPFGWESPNVSDELTLQIAVVEAGLGRVSAVCELPLVCWNPSISGDPDVYANVIHGWNSHGQPIEDHRHHVVHFGGDHQNVNYRREKYRLAMHSCFSSAEGLALKQPAPPWLSKKLWGAVAYLFLKAERAAGRLGRLFAGPVASASRSKAPTTG